MRDSFELLPEDVEYLDANYRCRWHKCVEGEGKYGVLIEGFKIPPGLVPSEATLMILMPAGYPASPLDMFYFDPPLQKKSGGNVEALAKEEHFGRCWQRWSRHYKWTPGKDDLVCHIEYVKNELRSASE